MDYLNKNYIFGTIMGGLVAFKFRQQHLKIIRLEKEIKRLEKIAT